ncbi:MAG: ABC transporter ATP-binding protein [Clostridia bacterium]|nr:ABC transporter ATP-binding protein [Clostridia bacterium]
MIKIENVTKYYGSFKAIDNVSIDIPTGSIHGLVGENGAGKTTLIRCITGIYKLDGGSITIDGSSVYDDPKVKDRMGYVADSNSYFPNAKIKEILEFFSYIYSAFDENRFHELNKMFELPLNKKIKKLSKGMQMRLSLMLNLSLCPNVLVLDEPTSGLDAIAKKQVLDLLISEVSERNCTIIISSHHLGELEKLCDSLSIMQRGKIIYQDTIDRLKSRVVKFQAVFREAPDLSDIDSIINVENIGSIYYIIADSNSEEIKEKLLLKGAELVEQTGMSLEEIFIYTSSGKE